MVHKIDPRLKLGAVFVYTILICMLKGISAFALTFAILLGVYKIAKIPLKVLWKNLKVIIPIVTITAIINVFLIPGDVIFEIWFLKITKEGLVSVLLMFCRVSCLVSGTALLTFTTSPASLVDALEYFMRPVKMFGGSPNEIAMTLSIALRFIPTLFTEIGKIIATQKSRGAPFNSPKFKERLKAYIPVIVPLFYIAFKRAEDLAYAMESRCYVGGDKRTRFRVLSFGAFDFVALMLMLTYAIVAFWVDRWRICR
ncbi:energy-coupling factor transporter transmembrane protein EcfT [Clostridia bacterium]|nr:energy-coupling factor transporter transmembrane protein EcfT [Clostridia bacterium]